MCSGITIKKAFEIAMDLFDVCAIFKVFFITYKSLSNRRCTFIFMTERFMTRKMNNIHQFSFLSIIHIHNVLCL